MDMENRLEEIRGIIYEEVKRENFRNSKELRSSIIEKVSLLMGDIPEFTVKCDEENNPPDLVYSGSLKVVVRWKDVHIEKYCDLDF